MANTLDKKGTAGRIAAVLAFILCIGFLFANFYIPDSKFQSDSENLAMGSIAYGRDSAAYSAFGLQFASIGKSGEEIKTVIEEYYGLDGVKYKDYTSQVGLQGYIYQTLSRILCTGRGVSSLLSLRTVLTAVCAALTAASVMAIVYLAGRKYNGILAAAFYLTFLLSPWVADFAQNLYWVEFTWFVPVILGMLFSLDYEKYDKPWMYVLIALSIAVKSACGYEYISTIMLGLIMFPLVDLIMGSGADRKRLFIIIVKIGLCALAGFFAVLIIHAFMRGDGNPIAGLKEIYEKNILCRTIIGDPDGNFTTNENVARILRRSIEASVGEVLALYFDFNTAVLLGFESELFVPMIVYAAVVFVLRAFRKENRWELALFVLSFIASISWFVLGKSHSQIHTHMNFVLWYFGFVQMCLYGILCSIAGLAKRPH